MIFTVIMNPGTLGYILVIEVLKTKDLDGPRIPVNYNKGVSKKNSLTGKTKKNSMKDSLVCKGPAITYISCFLCSTDL